LFFIPFASAEQSCIRDSSGNVVCGESVNEPIEPNGTPTPEGQVERSELGLDFILLDSAKW
jgi:hypothetical protein